MSNSVTRAGESEQPSVPAVVDAWQPIETAPKVDRESLLLWVVHPNAKFARDPIAEGWAGPCVGVWLDFNDGGWSWLGVFGVPTHWMPITAPATTATPAQVVPLPTKPDEQMPVWDGGDEDEYVEIMRRMDEREGPQ